MKPRLKARVVTDATIRPFLRRKDVEKAVGLGRTSIYDLIAEGKFPKPVRLSAQNVGWVEAEILEWQRQRIAERDAGYEERSNTAALRAARSEA